MGSYSNNFILSAISQEANYIIRLDWFDSLWSFYIHVLRTKMEVFGIPPKIRSGVQLIFYEVSVDRTDNSIENALIWRMIRRRDFLYRGIFAPQTVSISHVPASDWAGRLKLSSDWSGQRQVDRNLLFVRCDCSACPLISAAVRWSLFVHCHFFKVTFSTFWCYPPS